MTEVHTFAASDIERYADVLVSVARSVADLDLARAKAQLAPIAGELWQGRLTMVGAAGQGGQATGSRSIPDGVRAAVFMRDNFRCVYCRLRAVPRSILVGLSDLFPDQLAYHPNYARGKIHPVFWALAPEADHVLAHSRGGSNDLENLATLHTACNVRKADLLAADLPAVQLTGSAGAWDGLLAYYPAIVAAGGDARPAYHSPWLRYFGLTPTARALEGDGGSQGELHING